jgi:cob(I)alamin adenosyltransferase
MSTNDFPTAPTADNKNLTTPLTTGENVFIVQMFELSHKIGEFIATVQAIKDNFTSLRSEMATKADLAHVQSDLGKVKTDMATKADLALVQSDLTHVQSDLTHVKSDLDKVKTDMATKADLANVQADLDKVKTEMATKADLAIIKSDLAYMQSTIETKFDSITKQLTSFIEVKEAELKGKINTNSSRITTIYALLVALIAAMTSVICNYFLK